MQEGGSNARLTPKLPQLAAHARTVSPVTPEDES
jgi:hypothetical protein